MEHLDCRRGWTQKRSLLQRSLRAVVGLAALTSGVSALAAAATSVSEAEALQAARAWISRSAVFAESANGREGAIPYRVEEISVVSLGGRSLYVAQLAPSGYVLVNCDRRLSPVPAFGSTGRADLSDVPGNTLRALLEGSLEAAYSYLEAPTRDAGTQTTAANQARWGDLLSSTAGGGREDPPGTVVVSPMISTSWNQNRHYNYLCPNDPGGSDYYDRKAPTGCVPTAFAQMMRFHAWPWHGVGEHSYTDTGAIAGDHSASFADPYAWGDMQNSYDPWAEEPRDAVDAVAELMYELGVAAEIDYESSGSSSSTGDLMVRSIDHLFYQGGEKLNYSDDAAAFEAALHTDILAGRPAVVSVPGHAIVADGLSEESDLDYYHFKYGWGGTDDGWYLVSNVAGEALYSGVFGMEPAPVPLITDVEARTVQATGFSVNWTVPQWHAAAIAGFELREGRFEETNFTENCDTFERWHPGTWTVTTDAARTSVYRRESGLATGMHSALVLTDPVRADSTSALQFDRKFRLSSDRLEVSVSTDNGLTFTLLETYSSTYDSSYSSESLDLSEFAGSAILLRFLYVGGRYYVNGGVWIDNIAISDSHSLAWTTVSDDLASDARSHTLTDRTAGEAFYRLRMLGEDPVSPPVSVTIEAVTHNVTFDPGDHGAWGGGGALSQSVPHGQAAEQPIVEPDTGWTFTGWDPPLPDTITDTFTTTAQYEAVPVDPGKAMLLEPSGTIQTMRPTLRWESDPGTEWYYVQIQRDGSVYFEQWTQGTELAPWWDYENGDYTWYVQTWGNGQFGPWSDAMQFTVAIPGPAAPAGLQPDGTSQEHNILTFQWNAVANAEWYYLYVALDGAYYFDGWYNTHQVGHWQLCFEQGAYSWWVQAWQSGPGLGEWSAEATFTVTSPLDPPGQPALAAPAGLTSGDSPTFTWTGNTDSQWNWIVIRKDGEDYFDYWVARDTTWQTWWQFAPGNYQWYCAGWNHKHGTGAWSDGNAFTVE